MKTLNFCVLPGDEFGKEIVPATLVVLDTLADIHGGVKFQYESHPWSCEYYLEHGEMIPKDGMESSTKPMQST